MLSGVLRWFPGWVRVETEGGYPERLLNGLTKAGIHVWGVRCRHEWMRFSCPAGEYKYLRPLARRACVRMRVRQKFGLPFWIHRYRHRRGLLIGAAFYVLILCLLAPRIWVVQVRGNAETPAAAVLEEAEKHGVRIGASVKDIDVKRLQISGLEALPSVAWLTVNPSGCVARIEVKERRPAPEVLDLTQPSDLVAVRDGRILRMEVRSGQRLVKDGEAVTAGTVLVTGRVASEMGEKLYRSYGEVWAETRRQITVEEELVYQRRVLSDRVIFRPVFSFLGWEVPLFSEGALPEGTDCRQEKHFLTAYGKTLPLGVIHNYYTPTHTVKTARTRQQAAALAAEQLKQREKDLFLPDSYEEIERKEEIRDGRYVLTATYRCRENIGVEVPIQAAPPLQNLKK